MPDTSVLNISGMGVPAYSIRGARQTLRPIRAAANLVRTVNGELINISREEFQKYESTITCQDHNPPSVAGYYPGMIVTVDCIAEMSGTADRPVVSGSSYDEEGVTIFRPQLEMMIVDYELEKDEYEAITSWTMFLEEV